MGRIMRLILLLTLICACSFGAVTTTKYYDDRQMAVLWTSDDMNYLAVRAGGDPDRWESYTNAINLCITNNMVFNPGVVCGTAVGNAMIPPYDEGYLGYNAVLTNGMRMIPEAWEWIQDNMAMDSFVPALHSATHPTDFDDPVTTIEIQYIESRDVMYDALQMPWQFRYKGEDIIATFIQWGGVVNPDNYYTNGLFLHGDALDLVADNYLALRVVNVRWPYDATTAGTFPLWDDSTGMYEALPPSVNEDSILDDYTDRFDDMYDNGGYYLLYNHTWQDDCQPLGTNSATWSAWAEYVGNRKDVWYTDLNSMMVYHHLQTNAASFLTITETTEPAYTIINVTCGSAANRAKYGLSHPLTYRIEKAAGWTDSTPYSVYYRDTGAWALMTEKTTNDYFTGINCYRDDGADVLVSQGLPEWSETFQIKLIRTDMGRMPCLFGRAN